MREWVRRYLRVQRAPNGVLSIGSYVWMFTRIRSEDDWVGDPSEWPSYRMFVLHIGRLHLTAEWSL